MSTIQSTSATSEYPTTLPGLSADQTAAINARRRQATRTFQEALSQQGQQTSRLNITRDRGVQDIDRSYTQARREGMHRYGDSGLARNPRQVGRMNRTMRDEETRERSTLLEQDALDRAALQQWVDQARRMRDEELAAIEADMVRYKAEVDRLYNAGVAR